MTGHRTDADYLLEILSDGGWHTLAEILRRSDAERGHGLTVHSRVSDLRRQGHTIDQKSWRANGRVQSSYRLVTSLTTPDAEPDTDTVIDARHSASGAANDGQPSLFQIPASVPGAYDEAAA